MGAQTRSDSPTWPYIPQISSPWNKIFFRDKFGTKDFLTYSWCSSVTLSICNFQHLSMVGISKKWAKSNMSAKIPVFSKNSHSMIIHSIKKFKKINYFGSYNDKNSISLGKEHLNILIALISVNTTPPPPPPALIVVHCQLIIGIIYLSKTRRITEISIDEVH